VGVFTELPQLVTIPSQERMKLITCCCSVSRWLEERLQPSESVRRRFWLVIGFELHGSQLSGQYAASSNRECFSRVIGIESSSPLGRVLTRKFNHQVDSV
jgi:hypothetical protein